jgi:peptidoglycan hydrolase-like protein with peptidoglycan-binding domain
MSALGTKRMAVAIAKTQVGYHERAGNVQKYSKAFGRPAEFWCADGLSWVFHKAKVPHPINTASSLTMLNLAQGRGGNQGPRPGAVVRYTISHIELVIDEHDHTIGFNTTATPNLSLAAQRSGGAVAVKSTRRLHVDGFGMPHYAHDDGSALWKVFPFVRVLLVGGTVGRVAGFQVGPDVRRVQHEVGAVDGAGHADGQYGEHTAKLVREWQGDHHLKATGRVGPHTWNAMF